MRRRATAWLALAFAPLARPLQLRCHSASSPRAVVRASAVTAPDAAAEALWQLDAAVGGTHPAEAIVDACLDVCRMLPGPRGADALPEDARQLREAAAAFGWHGEGALFKQHLFDVDLWDDALEALALALGSSNEATARERALEAAEAVAASARFGRLPEQRRREVAETLAAAVVSDEFLAARGAALAAARPQRAGAGGADEAYAAARLRHSKNDFVAVPPSAEDDARIVGALYGCAVQQLGPTVLRPLGFPASELGLRSLLGAARAAGSQREVAALGRVWHAATEPAPIILRGARAHTAAGHGEPERFGTLVLVFSSLGWNGVVRAEYGATLRGVGDESGREDVAVAHCLDTAQSWFVTDPTSGEYDDGAWWDGALAELCAPYERVCILGESMGATAALRYAHHATARVVALVPQVDVRDFGDTYAGRADFSDARKARLREAIASACAATRADVVLHVGDDAADRRQPAHLLKALRGDAARKLRVVEHALPGHALGAALKAEGTLRKVVLRDLLGHSYELPPARTAAAAAATPTPTATATATSAVPPPTASPPPSPPAAHVLPDADVTELSDGSFYNHRLGAKNVFEIDLDTAVVDEAARIFYGSGGAGVEEFRNGPFASTTAMREPYEDIHTPEGGFFAARVTWRSNIAWVSVDDRRSFAAFEALFQRARLAERFAAVVPHTASLRLYSAFYVVRSWCEAHNWHFDYGAPVGTHALTLITPIHDFDETESFQLSYKPQPPGEAASGEASPPEVERYAYHKGRAMVFGSGFEHSTEPGKGRDGQTHVYLCFTFGTDRQEQWPEISKTLSTQSRIVQQPDGELRLSAIGEQIASILAEMDGAGEELPSPPPTPPPPLCPPITSADDCHPFPN